MSPRLAPVLMLAVLAAPARPARADDAAAAAMAAIGQAGAATGGAVPGKKKDEGNGFRPLSAPQIQKTSGAPEKPSKKKSGTKSKPSKYRSTDLTESTEHVYRFNESAEPLDSAPKKKAPAKTSKKKSADPDDAREKAGACSSDEACSDKKSDGDAF